MSAGGTTFGGRLEARFAGAARAAPDKGLSGLHTGPCVSACRDKGRVQVASRVRIPAVGGGRQSGGWLNAPAAALREHLYGPDQADEDGGPEPDPPPWQSRELQEPLMRDIEVEDAGQGHGGHGKLRPRTHRERCAAPPYGPPVPLPSGTRRS